MERYKRYELSSDELKLAEELSRDASNEGAKEKLTDWVRQQEEWANGIDTSRANIEVNLRRAILFRAAGLREDAWDCLCEVREQAFNEQEDDLREAADLILDEMDEDANGGQ